MQMEALAKRQGAILRWKPPLLAALFESLGTSIITISGESQLYWGQDRLALLQEGLR